MRQRVPRVAIAEVRAPEIVARFPFVRNVLRLLRSLPALLILPDARVKVSILVQLLRCLAIDAHERGARPLHLAILGLSMREGQRPFMELPRRGQIPRGEVRRAQALVRADLSLRITGELADFQALLVEVDARSRVLASLVELRQRLVASEHAVGAALPSRLFRSDQGLLQEQQVVHFQLRVLLGIRARALLQLGLVRQVEKIHEALHVALREDLLADVGLGVALAAIKLRFFQLLLQAFPRFARRVGFLARDHAVLHFPPTAPLCERHVIGSADSHSRYRRLWGV
mmetsp:Transcript_10683/g.40184  ORF Transcript_10683/g.40184 Transcript_10683/m.40184 type:complete len:286 (+) Transcript_10683:657-1514(+)|eukprot:scaffold1307_cov200-Pinguiococcus_pyrenoidosus.AAC.140